MPQYQWKGEIVHALATGTLTPSGRNQRSKVDLMTRPQLAKILFPRPCVRRQVVLAMRSKRHLRQDQEHTTLPTLLPRRTLPIVVVAVLDSSPVNFGL